MDREVNRSLTRFELLLMRRVNQGLSGEGAPRLVSDALISGPRIGPSRQIISPDDAAILEERFGMEVDRLNEIALELGKLHVTDARVSVGPEPEDVLSPREVALADVLVRMAQGVRPS